MSTLIAMLFDDRQTAQQVRLDINRMQREHLVELEDSVVVYKDKKGKVKLDQSVNLTATGAASGGFWGLLIGWILSIPVGGVLFPFLTAAFGAGIGALGGSLSDYGIRDDMMEEVGAGIDQGKAALFVLVRHATLDKVLRELSRYHGKVLKTSLPDELEQKLRDVLEAADASSEKVAAQQTGDDEQASGQRG